jgi:hypothetical protein
MLGYEIDPQTELSSCSTRLDGSMQPSTKLLLVGTVLAAAVAGGCLDASVEACGGTGTTLGTAEGTIHEDNLKLALTVELEEASGLAAGLVTGDSLAEEDVELFLRDRPEEVSTFGKSVMGDHCRNWGTLEAGNWTVESYYPDGDRHDIDSDEAPGPTAPPDPVEMTLTVQPKEEEG